MLVGSLNSLPVWAWFQLSFAFHGSLRFDRVAAAVGAAAAALPRSPPDVEPGDALILHAELKRSFKGIWVFSVEAQVGGAEVCSAEIMVTPDVKNGAAKGAKP